jgi:hypothetical protein
MGDSRHTGVSSLTIAGNSGDLAWKYRVYSSVGSPIVDKDGFIYQVSDRNVVKLDSNGGLVWSVYLRSTIGSNLALAPNGTIKACGYPELRPSQQGVFAINSSGNLLWNWNNDMVISSSPVLGDDGTIYVGTVDILSELGSSGNASLVALDPAGHLKWQYDVGLGIASSPAITPDGKIVVVSSDEVIELNRNGTLNWTSGTIDGLPFYASVSINPAGLIFVKSNDSLVCLETNGTVAWAEAVAEDEGSFNPSSCTPEREIVTSGKDIYCFDLEGNSLWHYVSDSNVSQSVVIDADGSAIFATSSNIIALDTDGEVIWKHSNPSLTDDDLFHPHQPVLAPGGIVLITTQLYSDTDFVYAIGKSETSNFVILVIVALIVASLIAMVILLIWSLRRRSRLV